MIHPHTSFAAMFFLLCNMNPSEGGSSFLRGFLQSAPKAWHEYACKFLFRSVQLLSTHNRHFCSVTNGVQQLLAHSIFWKRQKYRYSMEFERIKNWRIFLRTTLPQTTVTVLSGKINFNPNSGLFVRRRFVFETQVLLRVNLTLHSLAIPVKSASPAKCLQICTAGEKCMEYNGYHSLVFVYPKHRHFHLLPDVMPHSFFNITGIFSILDANVIESHENETFVNLKPTGQYVLCQKYSLVSYHIKTDKLRKVVVVSTRKTMEKYSLHDGPGILSDTLPTYPVQNCSTFQCVLHIISETFYTNSEHFFEFYSELLVIQEFLKASQSQEIHFPNMKCGSNVCVADAKAEEGHQVHMNVNSLVIQVNFPDGDCSLSGIAVGEYTKYGHMMSQCKYHTATSPAVKLYSLNSSLTIVLFWYKSYSQINVSVNMSQVLCKPVVIDLCEFSKSCSSLSTQRCTHFINRVTQHVNLVMSLRLSGSNVIFYFKGWNDTCIVLSMLNTTNCAWQKQYILEVQENQIVDITSNSQSTPRHIAGVFPDLLTSDLARPMQNETVHPQMILHSLVCRLGQNTPHRDLVLISGSLTASSPWTQVLLAPSVYGQQSAVAFMQSKTISRHFFSQMRGRILSEDHLSDNLTLNHIIMVKIYGPKAVTSSLQFFSLQTTHVLDHYTCHDLPGKFEWVHLDFIQSKIELFSPDSFGRPKTLVCRDGPLAPNSTETHLTCKRKSALMQSIGAVWLQHQKKKQTQSS